MIFLEGSIRVFIGVSLNCFRLLQEGCIPTTEGPQPLHSGAESHVALACVSSIWITSMPSSQSHCGPDITPWASGRVSFIP